MSFKIAYCAGHHLHTPGKRLPKSLDPNETREWALNDRVARAFSEAAALYEGVELLRTDDSTGQSELSIKQRTARANAWGADLYIDIHHNAGVDGGSGGGVVVFSYPGSVKGAQFRNDVYDAIIAAGGLKGNRWMPKQAKKFDSLKLSKMPAILVEYGFMDSTTDAPIILTEAYSRLVGYATMEGVAKRAGLKKKPVKVDKPAASGYTRERFVRDIQKAIGVTVDGIPGQKTLGKTPTVSSKKNRYHAVVKPLQKRLNALGYWQAGTADGIAGKKFDAAVKAFQADNGCTVDGELTAGQRTWYTILAK